MHLLLADRSLEIVVTLSIVVGSISILIWTTCQRTTPLSKYVDMSVRENLTNCIYTVSPPFPHFHQIDKTMTIYPVKAYRRLNCRRLDADDNPQSTELTESETNFYMKHEMKRCVMETGVSTEDGYDIKSRKEPRGKQAWCFLECFYKVMRLMTQAGKYDFVGNTKMAKIYFQMDQEKLEAARTFIKKCEIATHRIVNRKGSCNIAKELYKCGLRYQNMFAAFAMT